MRIPCASVVVVVVVIVVVVVTASHPNKTSKDNIQRYSELIQILKPCKIRVYVVTILFTVLV